jgi:hypothetical protein
MLSRRYFLLSSLATVGTLSQPYAILAKKKQNKTVPRNHPHLLAIQPWSPTVTADFIGLLDDGRCCVANEFGKFLLVDLFRPSATENTALVISQLNFTDSKIIDFALWQKRGIFLTSTSKDDSSEDFSLKIVSLDKATQPVILSSSSLAKYAEVTHLTVHRNIVCIMGKSLPGGNLLSIFDISKGHATAPTLLSTLALPESAGNPVKCIAQFDRHLIILSDCPNSRENDILSLIDLANVRKGAAQLKTSTAIAGNYSAMSCMKDMIMLLGAGKEKNCQAALTAMYPSPHIIYNLELEDTQSIIAAASNKDTFLVLCGSLNGRRLLSLKADKSQTLLKESALILDKVAGASEGAGRLALSNNCAVVAAGTAGVEAFSKNASGWTMTANYSLPQLPASALATWENFVIMAGTDLRLYSIDRPEKPVLVNTIALPSAINAVAAAGSFVLTLNNETLTLRKISEPEKAIASIRTDSEHMCFDKAQQTAYLLVGNTNAKQYKLYSNSIVAGKSFDLQKTFTRVVAEDNYFAAASLNDLSLYRLSDIAELLSSRHFEDVAIRDFTISGNYIFASTIDRNCKAYLKVLSMKDKLNSIASLALPHDGVALAASGTRVATIGSAGGAQDLISIINVEQPASPQLLVSLPTIESSSSVALTEKLAIVAGRGLAIFSLE